MNRQRSQPGLGSRELCSISRPVWFILTVAALALLTAPLSACQDAPTPTATTVTVPFEMLPSNHMVMEAKLNDKGPFRLIFDLGSPVILLSNKAAEESGAIPKNAPKSFLFGTRGEGKIAELEVGELKATDLPVVVVDHPALKALGGMLDRPLDGIIGYTFFAHYKTTIDYKTRQMTFTPVDVEVGNLLEDISARMLGPKVQKTEILAPAGLWGLTAVEPPKDVATLGIKVESVTPSSPAAQAGIQTGDTLTTVNGRWTTTLADLYTAAADAHPGQPVAVILLRDGEERTLTLTPREGL